MVRLIRIIKEEIAKVELCIEDDHDQVHWFNLKKHTKQLHKLNRCLVILESKR